MRIMKRVMSYTATFLLLVGTGQVSAVIVLTTLDSSGTPLSSFEVGLASDQFVPFVEVDSSGNVWVGRSDLSHGGFGPNRNDMVAKFTPTGTELMTVKGPMRDPSSLTFDSVGNIYISGIPDRGSLSARQIYKYDPGGTFLSSFGELSGAFLGAGYPALEFASADRLFATTNNPLSVQELTTGGTEVNNVGSFDGTLRLGNGLALSPDGNTLWNYQESSGPGEDFIVGYDLNLNVVSSFGLGTYGNPSLLGLDTLANGNLVARDRSNDRILEFSTIGALVNEIDISSMGGGFRKGFAVDNNGNFLITNSDSFTVPPPTAPVPVPSTLLLFSSGLAALSAFRRKRLFRKK